jgi:hypothetical protein
LCFLYLQRAKVQIMQYLELRKVDSIRFWSSMFRNGRDFGFIPLQ